ncbi:hypothetical protein K443DRAFT_441115 [Laccaria amethystina LaAM-08-1]|uniref:Uncharacterized protein n=1 Tax=Laccaria amethystina LaAM-08-1 TaxID=1095629 RepID=A0A0C9Y1N6_9AGAR|nr:hypothetical protein K443DRAFT_441115 [Laccaria amethystina LaAM-08-1]
MNGCRRGFLFDPGPGRWETNSNQSKTILLDYGVPGYESHTKASDPPLTFQTWWCKLQLKAHPHPLLRRALVLHTKGCRGGFLFDPGSGR